MSSLKQIMYGVTVFLRPLRFGKSLLVSILQRYYDVDYAEQSATRSRADWQEYAHC